MKKKANRFSTYIKFLWHRIFDPAHFRRGPALACLGSFLVSLIVLTVNTAGQGSGVRSIQDFEVGRVADRDFIAEHSTSYIDEEATRIRAQAQEQLVPAVFRYSAGISADIRNSWNDFAVFAGEMVKEGASGETFRRRIQAEFPNYFSNDNIAAWFAAADKDNFREYGLEALEIILTEGIFIIDEAQLRQYNPDVAEFLFITDVRMEQRQVSYNSIITPYNADVVLEQIIENTELPLSFKAIAPAMLHPFLRGNVFFSPEESRRRIADTMERVTPVIRYINEGEHIIRKGFVITENDMRGLYALNLSTSKRDIRGIISLVLLIIFIYLYFVLFKSRFVLGRELSAGENYLLAALFCLYLIGAAMMKRISPGMEGLLVSVLFPTALIVMIPAVFMGLRLALSMALIFPLGAYLSGSFDTVSYVFALASGVAASLALKDAEKRMALFRAGLIIAAANCCAVVLILLMRRAGLGEYPAMLFWAALNGIISGMLLLGFLPPLEHALNAVTPFRLIELSDLNAPILRKLFTAAPGTYSHSIMVANLAEQACQDIGANALLARVGAYYHDIGKMDNPSYFVENQTDYNRHDDIAPRLSATVIRSHVKLGVEKARSLGLPNDVIHIISEHHGNSLISWFYNKATQQEEQVSSEDFAYPGVPPRSKESAVVMLADVTEAAVRTLSKPTAAKIEKFIQQLFAARMEQGQLAESELSFRDLETIKNAFVKVLAGYYHSRIEYPNQKEEEKEESQ
ncbi:MAG: HDIG domain-containing protein [Treponema sp.]|jgi:putative nucleotidyltransferase with HDIG domain|nr:HDIG domain-containing protein [Treponema sp.]